MDRKEIKEARKAKRARINAGIARNRTLKNFLIWLGGIITGIILFISAFAVMPISPIVNLLGEPNTIVSEKVANKSLVGVITGLSSDTVNDYPIIKDALAGILGEMSILDEREQVTETVDPTAEGFNYKNYYYEVSDGEFALAFNEDNTYKEGVDANTVLYYPSISESPISEFPERLIASLGKMKVVDLVGVFGQPAQPGSLIYDILGETTVDGLATFEADNIKLSAVLGAKNEDNAKFYNILESATNKSSEDIIVSDLTTADFVDNIKLSSVLEIPTVENEFKNETIYEILKQATGATGGYEEIKISSLNNFNVDNVQLTSVLKENAENEKLFNVLKDVTGKAVSSEILLGDLNSFDVSNIKLGSIMENSSNDILSELLQDPEVTVGNIGNKINALRVEDVYERDCFVASDAGMYYLVEDETADNKYVLISSYNESVHGVRLDNKKYSVSSESSVWLFMYYNHTVVYDEYGNATMYTHTGLTFEDMSSSITAISESINSASIRMLVDSGVLNDPYEDTGLSEDELNALYSLTLAGALSPNP